MDTRTSVRKIETKAVFKIQNKTLEMGEVRTFKNILKHRPGCDSSMGSGENRGEEISDITGFRKSLGECEADSNAICRDSLGGNWTLGSVEGR